MVSESQGEVVTMRHIMNQALVVKWEEQLKDKEYMTTGALIVEVLLTVRLTKREEQLMAKEYMTIGAVIVEVLLTVRLTKREEQHMAKEYRITGEVTVVVVLIVRLTMNPVLVVILEEKHIDKEWLTTEKEVGKAALALPEVLTVKHTMTQVLVVTLGENSTEDQQVAEELLHTITHILTGLQREVMEAMWALQHMEEVHRKLPAEGNHTITLHLSLDITEAAVVQMHMDPEVEEAQLM